MLQKINLHYLTAIESFTLKSHQYFSETIWQRNDKAVRVTENGNTFAPSYHSDMHIQAVIDTSRHIVREAKKGDDPLRILTDFDRYCETEHFSESEKTFFLEHLEEVFVLAFATHDLGNITLTNEIQWDAPVEKLLSYSEVFQLKAVVTEERSVSLSLKLIEHYFPQEYSYLDRLKQLVKHLIMQTVFNPTISDSTESFWLSVQLIDQIASHFFSKIYTRKASAGYLNELYVGTEVGNRVPMSLKTYVHFLPDRLVQLLPENTQREEFLTLIDLHREKRQYLDIPANIPDRPIQYGVDVPYLYALT